MAITRVNNYFKDIDLSFKVNPINYDVFVLKNQNSIARSIRNIVLTSHGERFFNQNFGGEITRALFENYDNVNSSIIKDKISNSIKNYEPRVELLSIDLIFDEQEYTLKVSIKYNIIGIDSPAQLLTFALLPSR